MWRVATFLLLAVNVISTSFKANPTVCSVVFDVASKALIIKPLKTEPYVAQATFSDTVKTNGWSALQVVTNETFTDKLQAQAAGMAEGFITSEFIHMHYMNTMAEYCTNEKEYCAKLTKFISDNNAFKDQKLKAVTDDEKSYWHQVDLIYTQLQGMQQGYAKTKQPAIDATGFMLMQISGDLEDLEQVLGKKVLRKVRGSGHCSAFIKLLPKNADLLVSQVTWNDYNSMLRIYKLYKFGFHRMDSAGGKSNIPIIPGRNVSFSSYPGLLYSGDDFHILSSGLVTQETTIGNSNAELWQYVTPESLLEWVRVIVANRLARSGSQWGYIFEKYNSGTYNNQWMIVDYKQFTPEKPLREDTLWIIEQIPGSVQMADMTLKLIKQSYWSSYNIPYFPFIYNQSGVTAAKEKFGSWFDYDMNPRAQIFKRDQAKVVDIHSLFNLMRYNDYKNDKLAKCDKCTPPYSAENAISARSDLNPPDGKYPFPALGHRRHGGTDCKATSFKLVHKLSAWVIGGPTHAQQPVFTWSKSGWKTPLGHPDAFNFAQFVMSFD